MCISGLFPHRDITRAVDSTSVAPQYRRGGSAVPSNLPECSESHELETLMPPGSQESIQPLAEAPEEQSLMARANPEEGEDGPAPETKVKTCGGGGGRVGGVTPTFPDGTTLSLFPVFTLASMEQFYAPLLFFL